VTEHDTDTVTEPDSPLRARTQHRGGAHRASRAASGTRKYRMPTARLTKVSPAPPATGDAPASAQPAGRGPRSRSRIRWARLAAGVIVAGLVGVGLVRPGVSSAEPTVTQFLLAWQSKHYLAAAELTTGPPGTVARQLAKAYQRLDASDLTLSMRGISQHGKTATAQFEASVDLGGSGLTWSYANSFGMADGSSGWRVQWSPSVIVPGMTDREQLAVISDLPPRAQLLSSAGKPLEVLSKVYEVGVYPGRLTDLQLTAAELAGVTKIQSSQIAGQMQQSLSSAFLPLLTLSPHQYAQMSGQLRRIPGIQIRPRTERLFASIAPDVVGSVGTETASILRLDGEPYRPGTTVGESGLQLAFQRQLTGTPKTEVVLQQARGKDVVVQKWLGTPAKNVRTTLNSTIQIAADRALSQLPTSATIVAVQASTGKILAVASHKAGRLPTLNPLDGKYSPGQAFTIISSAAVLADGMSTSDQIPCLESNPIDGRNFANDPPVQGLGSKPSFTADFAHGCSSAFAGLALSTSATELTQASQEFGIDGGWSLPVSDSYAGALGQTSSEAERAAAVIGLGGVQVSPLGMALAAAVVDSGHWHAPSLVAGLGDPKTSPPATASAQVLAELRALMRSTAMTAPNSVADIGGKVYGQAGNAPFSGKRVRISWFVGYDGGIAFAVAELSRSASTTAAPLVGSFLQNVRAGS
jgi:cell division protein FtsI/penicillin-binding protein 2